MYLCVSGQLCISFLSSQLAFYVYSLAHYSICLSLSEFLDYPHSPSPTQPCTLYFPFPYPTLYPVFPLPVPNTVPCISPSCTQLCTLHFPFPYPTLYPVFPLPVPNTVHCISPSSTHHCSLYFPLPYPTLYPVFPLPQPNTVVFETLARFYSVTQRACCYIIQICCNA